jgi:hypothetical protein
MSPHNVEVVGDRPMRDEHGNYIRYTAAEASTPEAQKAGIREGDIKFERVRIILRPGEASYLTHGLVDADFVQSNGALIDGHDSSEVFKVPDFGTAYLYDDILTGGVRLIAFGFEIAILSGSDWGWQSAKDHNLPACPVNPDDNDVVCR